MSVICDDIPNTEDVKKALCDNIPSMVRVRYVGESKIPGLDATKLAPCVLPVFYKNFADKIDAFQVFKDDVWVASYPKCGTTWTQEMVWLIANDLNFDGAKKTSLTQRYSFFELTSVLNDSIWGDEKCSVDLTAELPHPRFIKTHLPIVLLPTEFWAAKPKLVYVARNPKDAAISFYHHFVNLQHYKESLDNFLDSFLNDLTWWSPFADHVLGYWAIRNEPNVLFLTYEEMSTDLKGVLIKVAKFFNKTYSEDQFNQLAKHLSFNEMKNNDSVNFEKFVNRIENQYGKRPDSSYRFFRRGQINSAKDEMSAEYHKKFDDWTAKAFNGSDFKFKI